MFTATAREGATYRAGVFYAGTRSSMIARELTSRRATLLASNGTLGPNRPAKIELPSLYLAPGRYVYAIRLAAWANPGRTSVVVSRPFRVAPF
jgi:hypothetical protein